MLQVDIIGDWEVLGLGIISRQCCRTIFFHDGS